MQFLNQLEFLNQNQYSPRPTRGGGDGGDGQVTGKLSFKSFLCFEFEDIWCLESKYEVSWWIERFREIKRKILNLIRFYNMTERKSQYFYKIHVLRRPFSSYWTSLSEVWVLREFSNLCWWMVVANNFQLFRWCSLSLIISINTKLHLTEPFYQNQQILKVEFCRKFVKIQNCNIWLKVPANISAGVWKELYSHFYWKECKPK